MFNFVSPHQLQLAAEKGHVNIVQYLIEKGANMNIKEWKEGGVSQQDCTTDHGLVLLWIRYFWLEFFTQVPDKGLGSTVDDYINERKYFTKIEFMGEELV